jgi:hypothetical protein
MTVKKHYVPKLTGRYVNVYKPQPDVYTLPSATSADGLFSYIQGETYQDWRVNDHTFARDENGRWHCFGITRPWVTGDAGHNGEGLCFHAVAPEGAFKNVLNFQSWKDMPKINTADCGWAPAVIKIADKYIMAGSHLGCAASTDLENWTEQKPIAAAADGARDPYILFWDNTYYLYRCAGNSINLITSADFVNWSEAVTVFKPEKASFQVESPVVVPYKGLFYLFWTLWDQGDFSTYGYCPRSYVYCSPCPDDFSNATFLTEFFAHAPEVIRNDEGEWFISSADYPHRGINIAPFEWH